jgi:hypothetical protein
LHLAINKYKLLRMQNNDDPLNTHSTPKPPGSDIGAALKGAAWYGAGTAAFAAVASKTPYLNRLYSAGMAAEAKMGAMFGALIGAVIGWYDNRVRRNEIYPLQVENHVLKHAVNNANATFQEQHDVKHVEKLNEQRQQKASELTPPLP